MGLRDHGMIVQAVNPGSGMTTSATGHSSWGLGPARPACHKRTSRTAAHSSWQACALRRIQSLSWSMSQLLSWSSDIASGSTTVMSTSLLTCLATD